MAVVAEERVYRAHAKQRAFHRAVRAHDYVLFNGGRGSGKTTAGAIQAILEAAHYQPGSRGIVVAPTYRMLADSTKRELLYWLPHHWIRQYKQSDELLILHNGSEIVFRSCTDPDSLRGPNRAWAWLDEARNLRTREAFDIVYAQLRPTRKLWITTTPSGIFHWLYDVFIQSPLPNSHTVTVRTNENPYLPDTYEVGLRSQYTGAFAQQELDAQWVSFEGRIYDNFDLDHNVTTDAEYNPALEVVWGVDDGYAYGQGPGTASYHPRVFLLAQWTPQGGVNIFAEYYQTGELSERSLDNVLALPYARPTMAFVDSSAVELKARIWERDIQSVGSTHPVSEGIKNLRRLVCDGNGARLLRVHPRCANFIREMQSIRYDDGAGQAAAGEPKPLKVDDHGPDAARYLTWSRRFTS